MRHLNPPVPVNPVGHELRNNNCVTQSAASLSALSLEIKTKTRKRMTEHLRVASASTALSIVVMARLTGRFGIYCGVWLRVAGCLNGLTRPPRRSPRSDLAQRSPSKKSPSIRTPKSRSAAGTCRRAAASRNSAARHRAPRRLPLIAPSATSYAAMSKKCGRGSSCWIRRVR